MMMNNTVLAFCAKYTAAVVTLNTLLSFIIYQLYPNTYSFETYFGVTFVTGINAILIFILYFVLNKQFDKFVNLFFISIGIRLTFYGVFIYYIVSTKNVHFVKLIGAFLISYMIYQVVEIKFFVQTRKSRST